MSSTDFDFRPLLHRLKDRCISCAYLFYLEGDNYREVLDSSRQDIIDKKLARILCSELRCYKGLLPEVYLTFTPSNPDATMTKVFNTKCPGKNWCLHKDGINPEVSYQHEQQRKIKLWTKIGVGVGIITLIAVVAFSVIQLKSCSW